MAGTSKSYFRKANGGSFVTKTAESHQGVNPDGSPKVVQISYREWDGYTHGYTPGNHTMDGDGVCISNSGMSAGYYSQGPEHGDGGKQI